MKIHHASSIQTIKTNYLRMKGIINKIKIKQIGIVAIIFFLLKGLFWLLFAYLLLNK
jgi:hypothetical protein